jgi:hypothetical protein
MWTPSEKQFLKSLNTPEKIQHYIDGLDYNSSDDATSVRYVLMSQDAHCLEGGFVACAALELQGHKPLMVSLMAEDDDHHVLSVYRGKHGWGCISKSNTALLKGRDPVYRDIRELVMSYFEFYFNLNGVKSLYAYSDPFHLDRFGYDWRTGDENLLSMGHKMNDLKHYEIIDHKELKKLSKATKLSLDACLLGANMDGLFKP